MPRDCNHKKALRLIEDIGFDSSEITKDIPLFFDRQKNSTLYIHIANNRIEYLIEQDLLDNYFQALECEAYKLGEMIIQDINTILPCAMVAAHTATPMDRWFYRYIMRSLGSKNRPLLWFTHNLNYYGHQQWIKKDNLSLNKINALHSTNILLSLFNNNHDIRMINQLAQTHDGLWYIDITV